MSRGTGLAAWLAGAPDAVVVLAAVLTQLGDVWFLTLSIGLVYWLGPHTPVLGEAVDRDRMVTAVAAFLLAIAFTFFLKEAFAFPRPPWFDEAAAFEGITGPLTPVFRWFTHADGYGFPSGHAVAATVGWGALAWAVRVGRGRTRLAFAAVVVTTVSLTRLVLGVHFLVDVVAGAIVGLALLALVLPRRSPTTAFALAPLVGLAAVVLAGGTTEAAGTLGLAVGGLAGWLVADRREVATTSPTGAYLGAAVGVAVLVPLLAGGTLLPVPPSVTLFATAVGGFGVVVLPLSVARLEEWVAG